jgi:hypothetical protein
MHIQSNNIKMDVSELSYESVKQNEVAEDREWGNGGRFCVYSDDPSGPITGNIFTLLILLMRNIFHLACHFPSNSLLHLLRVATCV